MSVPQYLYIATIPPEDGSPDDAGARSHEFQASNDELAREVCLAWGWRFDGRSLPLEPTTEKDNADDWKKPPPVTRRRRAASPQTTSNPPLSRKQIQALAIEARVAYDHLDAYDLIEEEAKTKTARFNLWRANLCEKVTGKRSFRELRNDHYRPLRAQFLVLAGKPFEDPAAMSRGPQSHDPGDTMEAREQIIQRISDELQGHKEAAHENAGAIGEAYLMTVAKRKNPRVTLDDFASLVTLPAKRLEELFITIRNRIAAKEGRGDSHQRNKKQRKRRKE